MSVAPYLHLTPALRPLMWSVAAGLLPALTLLGWQRGGRWWANALVAVLAAVGTEALLLALRRKSLRPAGDGSAVITALLLTLALPQSAPLWLLLTGTAFALIFGKQLYGGLGHNPFNPAMVGYAFCLLSWPAVVGAQPAEALPFMSLFRPPPDMTTAATLLDASRSARIAGAPLPDHWDGLALAVNGSYLLSAGWLAAKRFLDGRIVLAFLLGAGLAATLFHWHDPRAYLGPLLQLNAGAIVLGACFIATDPTTAATTGPGRWLFGLLVGALAIAIRNLGNYPDGVAFAVLLGNALVPLIDPLTAPQYR